MTHLVAPSVESIRLAAEHLAAGRLVGIPTETVYGLAANATDAIAVAKIFAAKGRPANNPLIVHVADATAARTWIEIDDSKTLQRQWEIATQFWPGPLTVVVPRSDLIPSIVSAGADTVAIRVPNHPVALDLLNACPFPLAAPSANRSNYVSPTQATHVIDSLGGLGSNRDVALVLDGGECQCGVESTIIRLSPSGPVCLRYGGVSIETLELAFGAAILRPPAAAPKSSDSQDALPVPGILPAPGMLSKHYSPTKPMVVFSDWESASTPASRVARIAFQPLTKDQQATFAQAIILSDDGDLAVVAQKLFASLRQADQMDVDLIVIDTCERLGIGAAIMDRIDRAVA